MIHVEAMLRRSLILLGLSLAVAACERVATVPADDLDAALAQGGGLIRSDWPSEEDPGPPFYARIEPVPPHVFMVDGWVVIPFYRDPDCIRRNFNLLLFFDPPAAFGCPLTVEGFSLRHGGSAEIPPKISHSQGTGAVPFWFIPAGAVLDAMQDGMLTIGELTALVPLVGYATHFNEVLHPHPLPPALGGGGGHPNPKIIINAHGMLMDGRRFQFHLTKVHDEVENIRLRFW
jgi:hypothetical protein